MFSASLFDRVHNLLYVRVEYFLLDFREKKTVGATSEFVIVTLKLCPFIRATGILLCVDAAVQFFFFFQNLANLTVVLQCGPTFENHFGALHEVVYPCALRRDLLANVLKRTASVSCGKQLVESGGAIVLLPSSSRASRETASLSILAPTGLIPM